MHVVVNLHSEVRPSCLQATPASLKSQKSSHTVPHCPWKHTSTRPSRLFLPPTSRISVLLQAPTTDEEGYTFNETVKTYKQVAIALFMHRADPTLWTDHSSIFIVITVVDTNSSVCATTQDCLISTAAHIVQEDGSSSRRKGAIVVLISDCYCICTNWFATKWNKVTNTMHLYRLPINSNWSIIIEQPGCMGTPTYSL